MDKLPNNIFDSINDFQFQAQTKILGSGSFGVVKKATHKHTGKIYAIKIIELKQDNQEPEILLLSRQITIHYQLNHPHIVKLWAVIEDDMKIYMVMDYAENPNLFNYLIKKKNLTQAQSFRIFYQVLTAVEYLHNFDVFHRDLKPENILLDSQLNVKLCDFGWVADEINKKRTTFCGTYEYMAPEMVKEIPYNYKIDIWALGILLYELNHGKAPFAADSAQAIKQKLQKGVYEIKETLSYDFKTLLVGILQIDPSKRFQIEEIKKSSWIKKYKSHPPASLEYSKMYSHNSSVGLNQLAKNQYWELKNKEDKSVKKVKKNIKKYRTLEQQDLLLLTQNLKGCSPFGSTKQNHKTIQLGKQLRRGLKQIGSQSNMKNRNEKKEKTGSIRSHIRSGTQSGQIFHKKLSKIIFQDKHKLFQDQYKKKIITRRN